MANLVLLRHGQSVWNRENLFTGWVDVPLSEGGIIEAQKSAQILKNYEFDCVYVSSLVRAMMTAMIALAHAHPHRTPIVIHEDGQMKQWAEHEAKREKILPVFCRWQLNERYYGKLQGLNKQETAEKYGQAQVQLWRRSYDVAPPQGESLKMTAERTIPFFREEVLFSLREKKNVLISAHGNSLRSIIKDIEGLGDEEVVSLEIPTGVPIVYRFTQEQFVKET